MGEEIERKFLVATVPEAGALGPGRQLRQGYLAGEGDTEVRLRFTGGSPVLTIKAGRGLTRTEVEVPLSPADAEQLWSHTEGRRIEKVRHRVPVAGDGTDLVAEVDRYDGALAGLWTVEVEFASEDDAHAFVPPSWFGRDVTDEAGWSNRELARHGRPDGADGAG